MTRLTKRLENGTAAYTDYSIHTQMAARERLCRLEEELESGKLVYADQIKAQPKTEKAKTAAGARSKSNAKKSSTD